LLIVSTLLTAGLLRQAHDQTPRSPYVSPVVGSLLFVGVFFFLLVSAREWRLGASPGPGIRIGNLTPLLLMLLMEKWISLSAYNPVFYAFTPVGVGEAELDAMYRAFAGVGLLLMCLLFASFSRPATREVRDRARPVRWPVAVAVVAAGLVATYGLFALLSATAGAGLRLAWPDTGALLWWVLGGQAILAFAEEVYYRGLLLSELKRLAPRLGLRSAAGRRWFAITATALLFGMEHHAVAGGLPEAGRQLIFTVALGLLLGILVELTSNLHLAAGVHAWINWLLLGAAPVYVGVDGAPALAAGPYIGVFLIVVFCLSMLLARRRDRFRRTGESGI
jgi:membrane protease YdiL (CAAX protease family)